MAVPVQQLLKGSEPLPVLNLQLNVSETALRFFTFVDIFSDHTPILSDKLEHCKDQYQYTRSGFVKPLKINKEIKNKTGFDQM